MFNEAKKLRGLGYNPLPIAPNDKRPPVIDWKILQVRKATLEELKAAFPDDSKNNLGVVCGPTSGDLFVKDFDTKEGAREFYKKYRKLLRTVVETPRGVHFWFRKPGGRNRQGDKQDDRGNGGYSMVPPSTINGVPYRYVDGHPVVPADQLLELPDTAVERIAQKTVRNVEAYVSKIQSVQGKKGNSGLVRFICRCRDEGLSQAKCMELLLIWNESDRVSPPWSLQELSRAVENLYGRNQGSV